MNKRLTSVCIQTLILRYHDLPGVAGLLGPQSVPPEHPAGLCTAPGSDPSPHVLGWPGSRCELLLLPCQAASAKERHRETEAKIDVTYAIMTKTCAFKAQIHLCC